MFEYIGYTCAFLAIVSSFIEFTMALTLRSHVKNWSRHKPGKYPALTVIAPQRGKIVPENIEALLAQQYPGTWEVIFVTTEDDASLPLLKNYSNKHENVRIVIADDVVQLSRNQCIHRTQKNSNVVAAINSSSPKTEVYVIVDADARPFMDWLRNLAAPFTDGHSKLGAVTSARLYLPGKGLASWVQALWIINSAPFLAGKHGYIWGGGLAISKAVFEKANLISSINGQGKHPITSEDNNINNALRTQGYETVFVPDCIVPRYPPDRKEKWRDVISFTNRQVLQFFWTNRSRWLLSSLMTKIRMPMFFCAMVVAWWYPLSSLALLSPLIDMTYSFIIMTALLTKAQREALNIKLNLWAVFLPMLVQILNTINFLSMPYYRSMKWSGIEYTRRKVVGYTGNFSWREQEFIKSDKNS